MAPIGATVGTKPSAPKRAERVVVRPPPQQRKKAVRPAGYDQLVAQRAAIVAQLKAATKDDPNKGQLVASLRNAEDRLRALLGKESKSPKIVPLAQPKDKGSMTPFEMAASAVCPIGPPPSAPTASASIETPKLAVTDKSQISTSSPVNKPEGPQANKPGVLSSSGDSLKKKKKEKSDRTSESDQCPKEH
jgi:hypothetical protein